MEERERAVERKVNSRERKDGKNQQRRIASEGEREKIEGKEREKEKKKKKSQELGKLGKKRRKTGRVAVPPSRGRNIVRDSKVDERVGSHVNVKDRNCEFVDPRVE